MFRLMVGILALAAALTSPALANAAPYRITGSLPLPSYRWDLLSVDPAARRLYIGNGGGVTVVDLDTNKITPELVHARRVHSAVAVSGTAMAAATSGADNTLILFSAATGAVIARIPTGREPDTVLLEPQSGALLTFNQDSDDATIVDPAARTAVATVPLGGSPEFATAGGHGLVYDNISDKAEIAVLDVAKRKVVRRFALAACVNPTGLAYYAKKDWLISVCSNGVAEIIDGSSGKRIARLAVGKGADAVILDASRARAFIPSGGSGSMSVIALDNRTRPSVIQVLETKRGVRTGAVDEKTGRLYLPSADFLPVKTGEFPDVVPGTVRLLIVSP